MRFRRPSAALVIASLALFVALTGTGLAAGGVIITNSSQIKRGVIQAWNLSPAARNALKGQRGSRGPQGPAGEQGPEGPSADVSALQNQVNTLQAQLNIATAKLSRICVNGLVYNAYLTYSGQSVFLNLNKVYCGS